tara:strand:+ start:7737 stop:11156 length:3420 start_codon:yes stop_codon:yes gene_type:complete
MSNDITGLHPSYNKHTDLFPDKVYNLNNKEKSWKLNAYNITAISGDDLIFGVSGDNRMIWWEEDVSYGICDFIGFNVLSKNLVTANNDVRIPNGYNNYSFVDPSNLGTKLTLTGDWIDLSDQGYVVKYQPISNNSKIHYRAKINYINSNESGQLITFRLLRDISGGASREILFTDSSLGIGMGVNNNGIYSVDYIDSPNINEDVTYYLQYKLEASSAEIDIPGGVVGYDTSNVNFIMTQELYIPASFKYITKDCPCRQDDSYTKDILVAGGEGTNYRLAYSLDYGEKWIEIQFIFETACNGIFWSTENDRFIAVGSGTEKIAYSTNGINWATIIDSDLIFSIQGNDVHWNNIRWVAVGEGTNSIAYSGEGLEWFTVTNSTNIFTKGNGVASNKKRWIAVGEGTNTIAYSDDGITWIGLGSSIFTTAGYNVIWNGIRWIAVGEGTNSIAYSDDNGITWTGLGTAIFTKSYSLANSDTKIVAVGEGSNTIAHSNDGINWTGLGNPIITTKGKGVHWAGAKFIAVGEGTHKIAYSNEDGTTWTASTYDDGTNTTNIFSTAGNCVATNKNYNYDHLEFTRDSSFGYVDISVNLGIRIDDAEESLHIKGDIRVGDYSNIEDDNAYTIKSTGELNIHTNDRVGGNNTNVGLNLMSGTGNDQSKISIEGSGTDTSRDITFYTKNTERVIIDQDGNVGIGGTSPDINTLLYVDGTIRGQTDSVNGSDTTSYFGYSAIGFISGLSDYSTLAHIDHNTITNYAVTQNPDGTTSINAPTSKSINFNINNVTHMYLDTNGNFGINTTTPDSNTKLDVIGSIRGNYDTDTTCYFGRTAIGFISGLSDYSSFAHIDHNTTTNYALIQNPDGTTSINAPAGKTINFNINNVTHLHLDTNGNFGINTTTPDSNTKLDVIGSIRGNYDTDETSYFGRVAIGFNSDALEDSDWASFAHIHCNNANDYSLMQGPGGKTYLNAKLNEHISFRINDQEEMQLDATQLDLTGNNIVNAGDITTAGDITGIVNLGAENVTITGTLNVDDNAAGFGGVTASLGGNTITVNCNNVGYGTTHLTYTGGGLDIHTLVANNLKNNAQITISLSTSNTITFKGWQNVTWTGCIVNFQWDQIIDGGSKAIITLTRMNGQNFLCATCFKA